MENFCLRGLPYKTLHEKSNGYSARTRELMTDVWIAANFPPYLLSLHPFSVFDSLLTGAPFPILVTVLSEWLQIRGVTMSVV
jgi:hypothetical protein